MMMIRRGEEDRGMEGQQIRSLRAGHVKTKCVPEFICSGLSSDR